MSGIHPNFGPHTNPRSGPKRLEICDFQTETAFLTPLGRGRELVSRIELLAEVGRGHGHGRDRQGGRGRRECFVDCKQDCQDTQGGMYG